MSYIQLNDKLLECKQKLSNHDFYTDEDVYLRVWKSNENPQSIFPKILSERKKGKVSILIYPDQLNRKAVLIGRMLDNHLNKNQRVYARNTSIKRISDHSYKSFARKHQLYFPAIGKINYGIYNEGELIGAASFGEIRINSKGKVSVELLQFVVKGGTSIVGGLSKVLKQYIVRHEIEEISTYCMMDWSNGQSFERVGFKRTAYRDSIECYVCYVKEVASLTPSPSLLKTYRGPRIKMVYDCNQ